jgi:hypothetical protein
VRRDNSVGLETRYELGSEGMDFPGGGEIPHPSRPALGSTQPPVQWLPRLFPGVKQLWCGTNQVQEVQEGV